MAFYNPQVMATATIQQLLPVITSATEGLRMDLPGQLVLGKLASEHTNGAFIFAVCDIEPGFGPPLHIHAYEDELFFVLEGELKLTVGDEEIVAKAGDTAFLPRGIAHKFEGAGDKTAKFTILVTGDNFERFYPRYAEALGGDFPNYVRAAEIADEHGIRFV